MESPGAGGRRRGNTRSNAEDQALDQIAREVSLPIHTTNLDKYVLKSNPESDLHKKQNTI